MRDMQKKNWWVGIALLMFASWCFGGASLFYTIKHQSGLMAVYSVLSGLVGSFAFFLLYKSVKPR